jgi:hypothetical protein
MLGECGFVAINVELNFNNSIRIEIYQLDDIDPLTVVSLSIFRHSPR